MHKWPAKVMQFLIKIYRYALSPFLGVNKCRFYPTCSCYAHDAIEHHGLIKGGLLGLKRIFRCHPWYNGEMIDPVPSSIDWRGIIGYNSACKHKDD